MLTLLPQHVAEHFILHGQEGDVSDTFPIPSSPLLLSLPFLPLPFLSLISFPSPWF